MIGLGHVGLPLAAMLARAHTVVGLDSNVSRVERASQGEPEFEEPGLRPGLRSALRSGRLRLTVDPRLIRSCRIKIVTVGTPYDPARKAMDARQLRSAFDSIVPTLRAGDVVILKSTVEPGTTVGELAERIRAVGLAVPEQVGLVFAPERMIEGRAIRDLRTLPKIVGATDARSFRLAAGVLTSLGGPVVRVSDPTTAEMVKLVDNFSRYAFLAVTNELAQICAGIGVDANEVLDAAKKDYPRNAGLLIPGPGVGGSCLNKDPFLLGAVARRRGIRSRILPAARAINRSMPHAVVNLLRRVAAHRRLVTVAGLSFKGDTDDTTNSPAFPIARRLRRLGFRLRFTDPLVEEWPLGPVSSDLYAASDQSQILVLLADHPCYRSLDLHRLASSLASDGIVVDARNLIPPGTASRFGLAVYGLGRPTRPTPRTGRRKTNRKR